ncbi:MAG: creatininase family protein [Eubacteriales bacterium]
MTYRKRSEKSLQLETWSSPEVQRYIQKDNSFGIIPVGSFEQHGPHAPLGTDTFICMEVSRRLARKLGGVVLPPVWFGISDEHMDFAGTVTVTPDTLCNLITDIVVSLRAAGFNKILVLNGHGGNVPYLGSVKEKVRQRVGQDVFVSVISYWDKLSERGKMMLSSLEWGFHANEYETSLISCIFPSMVKKLRDIRNYPDLSSLNDQKLNEKVFRDLIKGSNGVWGDPGRASIKKGRSFLGTIELSLNNYLAHELDSQNADLAVK